MASMPCMVSVVGAQRMILGLLVLVQQVMMQAIWKLQQATIQVILQIMPVRFMCVNIQVDMVQDILVFLGMVVMGPYKNN